MTEARARYNKEEIAIVKECYPDGGSDLAKWTLEYKGFEKRTKRQIRSLAGTLNLRCNIRVLKQLPMYAQKTVLKCADKYSVDQMLLHFFNAGHNVRRADIEFFLKCITP